MSFFATYWVDVLFSIITAAALSVCRKLMKQVDEYRKLLDEREDQEIKKVIQDQLEPTNKLISELKDSIKREEDLSNSRIGEVLTMYRYQLVSLCKKYLKQGFMTQCQYDGLSQLHDVYKHLGGNSQGDEYYGLALRLNIKNDPNVVEEEDFNAIDEKDLKEILSDTKAK